MSIQHPEDFCIFILKSGEKRGCVIKFATAQKLGHFRRLFIQPRKSEIGAYTLQRVNGAKSAVRIARGKCLLQFRKAVISCKQTKNPALSHP